MQMHRKAMLLSALLGTFFPLVAQSEGTPRQYTIEVKLISVSPEGQVNVICSPRILVLEGAEADIRIGHDFKPLEGVMTESMLIEGSSCKLKVVHKEDRLFLNATAGYTSGKSFDKDGAEATTTSVHIVKPIILGQKIIMPAILPNCHWEFLVWDGKPATTKNVDNGIIVKDTVVAVKPATCH